MAPSNQSELMKMMKISTLINDSPSAFRYPRGVGSLEDLTKSNENDGYNRIHNVLIITMARFQAWI